jgi:hypothetical protein
MSTSGTTVNESDQTDQNTTLYLSWLRETSGAIGLSSLCFDSEAES